MADIDVLRKLQERMGSLIELPNEEAEAPVQEAAIDAETSQINEEAKSPNLKTKPELVADEVSQEAAMTVSGQLAQEAPLDREPAAVAPVQEEPSEMDKYRSLMDSYEKKLNAPNKETEDDKVMNWLTGIGGAASVLTKLKGVNTPDVEYWGDKRKKEQAAAKKEDLSGIQNLQKMHKDYTAMQNANKSEKTKQDNAEKDRALKEKIAGGEIKEKESEFTKALHKKQAADFAESQEGLQKTSTALGKVEAALDAQLDYSKGSILGTGPIATVGGLTRNFSEETESLEAKFKEIDLKNMVSTFSGMSKAVDSDAERKAWKATQASITNDDKTNVQILLGSKSSLLKDKAVAEAKAEYVKTRGNLDGFKHPILEGKVTTMIAPDGGMVLVDKNKVDMLKQQGMKELDQHAEELSGGKPAEGFVTMISPNGQEARVKKDKVKSYLDKGATIKE